MQYVWQKPIDIIGRFLVGLNHSIECEMPFCYRVHWPTIILNTYFLFYKYYIMELRQLIKHWGEGWGEGTSPNIR